MKRTFHRFKNLYYPFIFLGLTACASHNPYNPHAAHDLYFCDHSRQIIISLADQGERTAISFNGEHMSLERIGDGIFSNSVYTLYVDDDKATLEREGVPFLSGCRTQQ